MNLKFIKTNYSIVLKTQINNFFKENISQLLQFVTYCSNKYKIIIKIIIKAKLHLRGGDFFYFKP